MFGSRFQALQDMLGRAGNAMDPNGAAYTPQGGNGLAGIRRDMSMMNGAPMKNRSNAMSVNMSPLNSSVPTAGTIAAPSPASVAPPRPLSNIQIGGPVAMPQLPGSGAAGNPISPAQPAGQPRSRMLANGGIAY